MRRAYETPTDKDGTEAAAEAMEAAAVEPSMMETAALEPAAGAPVEAASVPPAGGGRGGQHEGQHSHERENDDLLHGQLLLDGLHGREVSPPWRRECGNARFTFHSVTLKSVPWIPSVPPVLRAAPTNRATPGYTPERKVPMTDQQVGWRARSG